MSINYKMSDDYVDMEAEDKEIERVMNQLLTQRNYEAFLQYVAFYAEQYDFNLSSEAPVSQGATMPMVNFAPQNQAWPPNSTVMFAANQGGMNGSMAPAAFGRSTQIVNIPPQQTNYINLPTQSLSLGNAGGQRFNPPSGPQALGGMVNNASIQPLRINQMAGMNNASIQPMMINQMAGMMSGPTRKIPLDGTPQTPGTFKLPLK